MGGLVYQAQVGGVGVPAFPQRDWGALPGLLAEGRGPALGATPSVSNASAL